MRSFIIAVIAALALANAANAETGPYTMDANGRCHGVHGQFAKTSLCVKHVTPQHCRDPKTSKFTKCGTPGAVPA